MIPNPTNPEHTEVVVATLHENASGDRVLSKTAGDEAGQRLIDRIALAGHHLLVIGRMYRDEQGERHADEVHRPQ